MCYFGTIKIVFESIFIVERIKLGHSIEWRFLSRFSLHSSFLHSAILFFCCRNLFIWSVNMYQIDGSPTANRLYYGVHVRRWFLIRFPSFVFYLNDYIIFYTSSIPFSICSTISCYKCEMNVIAFAYIVYVMLNVDRISYCWQLI